MSTEKNDNNDENRLLELSPTKFKTYRMRLYYVRIHHTTQMLNLKLHFDNHLSLRFNEEIKLFNKNNVGPVFYSLDLNINIDNCGQLYIQNNDQFKSINEYRLNCSHVTTFGKTLIHEERQDVGHSLTEYLADENLFLFDIRFKLCYGYQLPGKNTYKLS